MADTATIYHLPTAPRSKPRVNAWRWNELEDDALDPLPQECQIIYLRVLRKHMDYATGIVGIKRTISYGQIKERLEYQPSVHSNEKPREYSQGQIKRLIQKLVDAGLAERRHDTSKGVAKMIFRLPLACSDAESARHERDTVTATRSEADDSGLEQGDRDTSATQGARHPSGVRYISTTEQPAREDEFAMHWDWSPSDDFSTGLAMRNPGLIQYLDEDLLTEFKTYWMGRRAVMRQSEWEAKLTGNLSHRKARMAAMPSQAVRDGEDGIPACPHEAILAAWSEELGSIKGSAPSLVDWMGSKPAICLEERWRESFNAKNPSGKIRYTDVSSGIAWFRDVFRTLGTMANFRQSDVDVFRLFYKDTFVRATKGRLREQSGGAVR